MIHFECHGSPDGFCLANSELVSWKELRNILIEINYACRLNLVIVLAVCNGLHLIKAVEKLDRAPFLAIIGPEVEVNTGDLERDFGAFYMTFFDNLDGYSALESLNQGIDSSDWKYHLRFAEDFFIKAYVRYYKDNCIGKRKRERIENLITDAMENPEVRSIGVNRIRKLIKQKLLVLNEEHFNKKKKLFFFIDKYPDNAERFQLSFDDVLSKL